MSCPFCGYGEHLDVLHEHMGKIDIDHLAMKLYREFHGFKKPEPVEYFWCKPYGDSGGDTVIDGFRRAAIAARDALRDSGVGIKRDYD